MKLDRAIRLASKWSDGHVCTLREGEAIAYHELCLEALQRMRREQESGIAPTTPTVANGNSWISVEEKLPEDLPENKGKKVISCLVSLKSTYPKGKPNTQKRQRQLQYYGSAGLVWEWSRIGESRVTHWMPLPEPPKEDA